MTEKELKIVFILDKKIESQKKQLELLNICKYDLQALDYTKDRIQKTGPASSQIEEKIEKIILLENEIKENIEKMIDVKIKIKNSIENIDGIEGLILEMRYLEGMKWEDIAERLGYNYRSVFKIHKRAIKKLKRTNGH